MPAVPASGFSDLKRKTTKQKYQIGSKIAVKKVAFPSDNTYLIKGSYVQYWLDRYYSRFINHKLTQIIVLVLIAILVGISGWAASEVQTDLPAVELINDKQSIKPYLLD